MREFYAALEGGVVVGIEAIGAMQWFLELLLELLEELGIVCRVGHPAKIRAAETRLIAPFSRFLLNFNFSVWSESLLAVDTRLAHPLEFWRATNLVEQRVGIDRRIDTKVVFCRRL